MREPFEGETTIRVRYPETDRMGVVHHGSYIIWFEVGRTELMRDLGCTYRALEDDDAIFLPVIDLSVTFRAPVHYDDVIKIRTRVASVKGVRIRFEYELFRDDVEGPLATGSTIHATVNAAGRPARMPDHLRHCLAVGEEITQID